MHRFMRALSLGTAPLASPVTTRRRARPVAVPSRSPSPESGGSGAGSPEPVDLPPDALCYPVQAFPVVVSVDTTTSDPTTVFGMGGLRTKPEGFCVHLPVPGGTMVVGVPCVHEHLLRAAAVCGACLHGLSVEVGLPDKPITNGVLCVEPFMDTLPGATEVQVVLRVVVPPGLEDDTHTMVTTRVGLQWWTNLGVAKDAKTAGRLVATRMALKPGTGGPCARCRGVRVPGVCAPPSPDPDLLGVSPRW